MKHPLLSVSAGALTLAIPLQMLAAYASPSALFWAWATNLPTHDVTAEAHLQMPKEDIFVSMWAKGTQEGGLRLSADSTTDVTVDVVAPKENLNVRLKLSMLTVDGDAYVKLHSVSGAMDKEVAMFSAQVTGKQWIMIPKSEILASGTDDPFEAISHELSMAGMDVSAADIRQLVSDIMDAGFSLRATKVAGGNEYVIAPKRGFVTAISQVVTEFSGEAGYDAMMSDAEVRKVERDVLKQLKMEARVRTDAQDKPVSASAWFTFKPEGGDVVVNGKMTAAPHKGVFAPQAPAGAVSVEEFVESVGGDASMFGNPFSGFGQGGWEQGGEDTWESDATWEDNTWESAEMVPATCEGLSATERLQATRQGRCGDQRAVRPRNR